MYWYWEKGYPESRVRLDVMVVKGVGREHRRSFFTQGEWGSIPCIVFEMASSAIPGRGPWEKCLKYEVGSASRKQERLHAERERRRADALAAEVERLKALLEQARGGAG